MADDYEPPLPKGVLAHVCDGRARFSFHDRRGDAEFFEALRSDLGAVQLVRGKIGISAVTAFWYAADALLKPKRGEESGADAADAR